MKNLVNSLAISFGIFITLHLHAQTYGTFYLQSQSTVPWPFDPYGGAEPITVLDASNHIFLVEDNADDFSAMQEMNASMSLMSEDEMEMDSMSMNASLSDPLDVGTNLWLEITGLTNNVASLRLSNTVADVQYEILGKSDLLNANWISQGFVFGSELTNWTATTADASDFPNHFYWARSWEDSDGNGIADWWELQNFGFIGVDPFGNPMGDGYDNFYKFTHGMNPNQFYTPAKPQLNVTLNYSTKIATATWLPSQGSVTGYSLIKFNWQTHLWTTNNFSSTTTSFDDDVSGDILYEYYDYLHAQYQLQAHYTNGTTVSSDWFALQTGVWQISAISGPNGSVYLFVPVFPEGATAIRFARVDVFANEFGDTNQDVNFDIPIGSFTNGLYLLTSEMTATPLDIYGVANYIWLGAVLGTNTSNFRILDFESPFYDGRRQLKENLIFRFRAALNESVPFHWRELPGPYDWSSPAAYEYSGLFQTHGAYYGQFDCFAPFEDNYLYRNFVFDLSQINSSGGIKTGAGGTYNSGGVGLTLNDPPTNQFHVPTEGETIFCFTNSARWLASYPIASSSSYLGKIGVTNYIQTSPFLAFVTAMSGSAKNYWGLPFQSALVAWSSSGLRTNILYAGTLVYSNWSSFAFYPEVAQPQFQTVDYNFWNTSPVPGNNSFSPTNQSDLLIAPVGNTVYVNSYAKLAVTNSVYSGVYGYLGQYLDKAYKITNGVASSDETSMVSPYGDFFATEIGSVALVTMPDVDTSLRGTGVVYCASMNVDANHDGEMNLSFNSSDLTMQLRPMRVRVNSGYIKPGSNGALDQDLPLPNNNSTNANCVQGKITCQRDLENFFRLWICGLPSLPANQGYAVTLSCGVVSGSPAINLYYAETNGGIGYLTDTNVAQGLVNQQKLYTVSNDCTYVFPDNFFDGSNKYFLFEGVNAGLGQFTLTVYKNGNPIFGTSVWVDLQDIADLYETAIVTDVTNDWPEMVEQTNASSFRVTYTPPVNFSADKQVAVFVHGWRVPLFDYYDFSDLMFKRLYWRGFNGRFSSLRWPTRSGDTDPFFHLDFATYNRSECIAFKSGTGTAAYLNNLRTRFPDYTISACAHSMGNIVMMQALKELAAANQSPIDNYVLMQAAVPAECYDTNAPDFSGFTDIEQTNPHSKCLFELCHRNYKCR